MSTFKPKASDYSIQEVDGTKTELLAIERYDTFDTRLLGLGDITRQATTTDAIAAIFDLQGFTNFCKQIEPQLSVPLFLNAFLAWLLAQIKSEMTKKVHSNGAQLWCPLPFFVKFMGDGLLVLWDASATNDTGRRNIIISCLEICEEYPKTFLQKISKQVVDAPPLLRCGLARGSVYSVGDGNDYVGSCINMAARLEKLPGATAAFNRRGFNLEDPTTLAFLKNDVVVKKIAIRGIGDNELIGLLKNEYEAMSPADRKMYREP